MITILLADDQPMVRAGLRLILEAEPGFQVVAEAANGLDTVAAVEKQMPDVVLLDIRMPGMDGIEVARRLCALPDAPRVLMLTTFDADDYMFEALRAGASGFLLKDISPERLAEAVRRVVDGEELLSPQVTRRLIEAFVRRQARPHVAAPAEALTAREAEVLGLVARGYSNAEIAKELVLSEATVKTHIARVMDKLGVRDRVHAVIWAYERGFVEPGGG